MPIERFTRGNIVNDPADVIVNTVNCVGVMGKGVAKAFADAFPAILDPYRRACRAGEIRPGTARIYAIPGDPASRCWAAMATKDHWRDPSQYPWIEAGLANLARNAHAVDARSIAIPRPGCGLGGLSWARVQPMLEAALSDFRVTVYL